MGVRAGHARPAGQGDRFPGQGASSGTAGPGKVFGLLYVEVPAAAQGTQGVRYSAALAWTGLIVLAAAVPAGLAFGLLSTRRLTRRMKRLAALTLEVADGDFRRAGPGLRARRGVAARAELQPDGRPAPGIARCQPAVR